MSNKLIQEKINELMSIQQIKRVSVVSYQQIILDVDYCPSLSQQSVYSNNLFALKILFPIEYPDKPVTVIFKDSIPHININPQTGTLSLAILKDDWCPFFSLIYIIESLTQALEEPEENYCQNDALFTLYKNNKSKYRNSIKKGIQSYNKNRIQPQSKIQDKNEFSFRKNVVNQDETLKILRLQNVNESPTLECSRENGNNQRIEQIKDKDYQIRNIKSKILKINETITLLTNQHKKIQQNLKKVQTNKKLKQLFESKLLQHQKMIEQLCRISTKLKQQLIDNIISQTEYTNYISIFS